MGSNRTPYRDSEEPHLSLLTPSTSTSENPTTPTPKVLYTVDDLLPTEFGRHSWLLTLCCTIIYGLGGVCTGLPIFLIPDLVNEEWDLPGFHKALLSSLFFVGNLLGLLYWGAKCDHVGRLPGVRIGLAIVIFSAVITFLAWPPYTGHLLLSARLLMGFGNGAVMNSSFVLLAELTHPQHRVFAKAVQESGFTLGLFWLAIVAYLTSPWPWQTLIIAFSPVVLAVGAALALPESPRYLVAMGDAEGALSVLRVIGKHAGCPVPPNAQLALPTGASSSPEPNENLMRSRPSSRQGSREIPLTRRLSFVSRAAVHMGPFFPLAHRSLRRRTALVGGAWLGTTLVYNGVLLSPVSFSSSLYAQQALGALSELPSYVIMHLMGDRLGRRLTWVFLLCLGGTPLLVLGLLPASYTALVLPLYLLARLGAAGASTLVYIAVAEQFPTTCRSLGVGYGASCGRFGSISSPFILLTPKPKLVLAAVSVAAAVCAWLLPETKGKVIPDRIEDEPEEDEEPRNEVL